MCGIVGIASNRFHAERAWLSTARDSLAHRGPSDFGEWWSSDGRVGFAHRRLSIVDLTARASQPMHLRERGLSIVFNGEIYNHSSLREELHNLGHKFYSQSDTEVLLVAFAEWGIACISRLNGMFSFAVYDSEQQVVWLARDRAGEKPLFYRVDEGAIYFASELKALLTNSRLPRRIEYEALDCYLAMGFVPGDRCILAGYNKLPAAHTLRFDLRAGRATVSRYWRPPDLEADSTRQDDECLLNELQILLDSAVGQQLDSDVPSGILLSGGIDSSLITAIAAQKSSRLRTFSIRFTGHDRFDETLHARQVARHFGTEHVELTAQPVSAQLLPNLARQFDEPVVDSSMFPAYLISSLVRQHCSVVLGGDGGDELFGGYDHYRRLLWLQENTRHLPKWFLKWVGSSAERYLPAGVKGRNYLKALQVDLNADLPLLASYFDVGQRLRLLESHFVSATVAELVRAARLPDQRDLLQRATRMDFENYLVDDILVKVDRTSMLNSVELRAPFLDFRVVEFAYRRVPSHLKATTRDTKILLKRLATRLLPPEFAVKRKQGFAIPLADWLKTGPFRELFWETLTSKDCAFNREFVQNLLNGQDAGRSNGERLFALVQFELWRKIYRVEF